MSSDRGNKRFRSLDRVIGIPLVAGLSVLRRRHTMPSHISQIGLLVLGAVGDLLLSVGSTVPALRKKYPQAKIVLFTSASNRGVISLLPPVDCVETIELSNIKQALQTLNKHGLDVLIDFGPWPRISAIQSALCNAKFTIGFSTQGQYRHYAYDSWVRHSNDVHELQNYLTLLSDLGITALERPQIEIKREVSASVTQPGKNPFIVCHAWPAGFQSHLRAWPEEHWAALSAILIKRGYDLVFTGGPADKAATAALVSRFDVPADRVFDVSGCLKLDQTAALLEKSVGVISVNTGIMHIAAALDCPMVALHGPTNPKRWGPLSPRARVVLPDSSNIAYLNLGFEYPKDVEPCMQLLTVDRVLAAFDDVNAS